MSDRRIKVLVLCSHPVQYASPAFRRMAQHPRLDVLVAYCSLQGAEPGLDPEFGVEVAWDVPLLEGYRWVHVPNRSPRPGLGRFFGLINPGLWSLIRTGDFDAVMVYTGYMYFSFWLATLAAKSKGVALLFGVDTTTLRSRDKKWWKARVKPLLLRWVFRCADVLMAGSSASAELMRSLGISEEHIAVTSSPLDNDWWTRRAQQVDRAAVRAEWSVPAEAPVVLFCAKFQPWKRPQDVVRAFVKANIPEAYLVYAGEGPMRTALEAEVAAHGVCGRVRMLGFVNQLRMPALFRAVDLFVLPSEYDPCPLVVCEAMLCGAPVVLSDEIRGRFDLIQPGKTGFIYPCGDVDALANIFREILQAQERLREMREAARRRMETWSPGENIDSLARAIQLATRVRTTSNGAEAL